MCPVLIFSVVVMGSMLQANAGLTKDAFSSNVADFAGSALVKTPPVALCPPLTTEGKVNEPILLEEVSVIDFNVLVGDETS